MLNIYKTNNLKPKRQEIKELVYELQGRYPGLKARAFGAMQRLPLPEWGPVEHRRRPLPEEIGEEYGIKHLPSDFKKREGYKRSIELARQFDLYRQDYCGCEFSIREKE